MKNYTFLYYKDGKEIFKSDLTIEELMREIEENWKALNKNNFAISYLPDNFPELSLTLCSREGEYILGDQREELYVRMTKKPFEKVFDIFKALVGQIMREILDIYNKPQKALESVENLSGERRAN